MAACAYAVQTREEEYLSVAGKYQREELNEFARAMGYLVNEMDDHPFTDVLGPYYCEVQSKFTRDAGGEFYTPQEVARVMAKMSINVKEVIEANKPVTINDPAAGSAGLILSLAEEFAEAKAVDLMRVTCQDISKIGCDMAYINMTLWGIPSRIIWGDTLRATVNKQWENIHWHRVGEPLREQVKYFMRVLETEPPKAAAKPQQFSETANVGRDVTFKEAINGQQEWTFE
jgi:type I restriction-modification system DNA methylase subunit